MQPLLLIREIRLESSFFKAPVQLERHSVGIIQDPRRLLIKVSTFFRSLAVVSRYNSSSCKESCGTQEHLTIGILLLIYRIVY